MLDVVVEVPSCVIKEPVYPQKRWYLELDWSGANRQLSVSGHDMVSEPVDLGFAEQAVAAPWTWVMVVLGCGPENTAVIVAAALEELLVGTLVVRVDVRNVV